jgi:hypothetical protein
VSASEPPAEDPPPTDSPAESPAQREAREKAEALVSRREHPTRDEAELKRPQSVLIGCVMAMVGAALLLFSGVSRVLVDESSSLLDDVDPQDVDAKLQSIHTGGWVALAWAVVLIVVATLAFLGKRWAATCLFVQAAIVVLYGLLSIVTGFAVEGVLVTVWSLSSATLVRFREASRNWYDALADAQKV